jgi:hypothetical protein
MNNRDFPWVTAQKAVIATFVQKRDHFHLGAAQFRVHCH